MTKHKYTQEQRKLYEALWWHHKVLKWQLNRAQGTPHEVILALRDKSSELTMENVPIEFRQSRGDNENENN